MKFFKNLKVRTKLIAAFLLVAMFIAIVGGISIYALKSLATNSSNMYRMGMQSVFWSDNVKQNVSEIEADTLKLVFLKDSSQKVSLEKEIKNDISKNAYYINSLKALQGDKSINSISTQENKFAQIINEIIKYVDEGNYDDAINNFKSISSMSTSFINELNNSVNNNLSMTKMVSNNNDTIATSNTYIIIILLSVGVILAIGLGILVATDINKPLMNMKTFSEKLANFDFKDQIQITRGDEFAETAKAMNTIERNIKELIAVILNDSSELNNISEEISRSVSELSEKSEGINLAVKEISNGIQETSASSEEITASIQEVDANINVLASKAADGSNNSNKSIKRVEKVQENVKTSIQGSKSVYEKQKEKIINAIEEGKVVEQISVMANTIASLSERTNLLALNAAIEAARAGDMGKGFAVVADEVRNLAEQSSEAVNAIHETIDKVKMAFKNLSLHSNEILNYVNIDVNSQFEAFIDTVDKYYNDSDFVSKMSEEIAAMSEELTATINEVTIASDSLAKIAQSSSENTEIIKFNVNDSTSALKSVSKTANRQKEISQKLKESVMKFKI